jgi:hypothetical protein
MKAREAYRPSGYWCGQVYRCSALDPERGYPASADGVLDRSGDRPSVARKETNAALKPLKPEVLLARREVVLANRRARKAAKPAYVNTDASWRDGRAGLAYEGALGTRTELVACADNHEGSTWRC